MIHDEDYIRMLAGIIEGAVDPETPLEKLKLALKKLKEGENKKAPGNRRRNFAERAALFERMRPYLSKSSYKYLIERFTHY